MVRLYKTYTYEFVIILLGWFLKQRLMEEVELEALILEA